MRPGRPQDFTRLAELAYKQDPKNPEVVGALVSLLQRDKRFEDAVHVLENWQALNPEDTEAQKKIQEIHDQMNKSDSVMN